MNTGQAQQAIDLGFEAQSLLTQVSSIEVELQQLTRRKTSFPQRSTPPTTRIISTFWPTARRLEEPAGTA